MNRGKKSPIYLINRCVFDKNILFCLIITYQNLVLYLSCFDQLCTKNNYNVYSIILMPRAEDSQTFSVHGALSVTVVFPTLLG